jgi:hypothetical protein
MQVCALDVCHNLLHVSDNTNIVFENSENLSISFNKYKFCTLLPIVVMN